MELTNSRGFLFEFITAAAVAILLNAFSGHARYLIRFMLVDCPPWTHIRNVIIIVNNVPKSPNEKTRIVTIIEPRSDFFF